MTDVTKGSNIGIDADSQMRCVVLSEVFAGEALAKLDACFISDDGKVYKSDADDSLTAVPSGVTPFDGFTQRAYDSGQPVTLFGEGAIMEYASGLTPGAYYYVSTNAGLLATADVSTGAIDEAVVKAISATEVRVIR